jgi:hypothetical protein
MHSSFSLVSILLPPTKSNTISTLSFTDLTFWILQGLWDRRQRQRQQVRTISLQTHHCQYHCPYKNRTTLVICRCTLLHVKALEAQHWGTTIANWQTHLQPNRRQSPLLVPRAIKLSSVAYARQVLFATVTSSEYLTCVVHANVNKML